MASTEAKTLEASARRLRNDESDGRLTLESTEGVMPAMPATPASLRRTLDATEVDTTAAKQDETTADTPWYDNRTPLGESLEAKDDAAVDTPWYDVRRSLALEAKEAKQFVIGAGRNLQSLAGQDQMPLLVGGAMLLAIGVVVGFVRRTRSRKAAEKALEEETYILMA